VELQLLVQSDTLWVMLLATLNGIFSLLTHRWMNACELGFSPIIFLIRTSAVGQPPQFRQLFVWYKLDWCSPAQFPVAAAIWPNINLPNILQAGWPTVDQLPWWISMKLSQDSASAG